MAKPTIALLIDGENIAASFMPSIMDSARLLGDPAVRCVFGDFSENRLSEWIALARQFAMEVVFQPSGGKGKNSADIAMTIKAMDLLGEGVCKGFCLVSSDRDFAPLATRLSRSGVEVYGIGEAKSDAHWRSACTDFIVLPKAPARKAPSLVDPKAIPAKRPMIGKPEFSTDELKQVQTIFGKIALLQDNLWIGLPQAAAAIRSEAKNIAERLGGKGKFLKNLRASGLIVESGQGSSIRIRLKDSSVVPIRAAQPRAHRR